MQRPGRPHRTLRSAAARAALVAIVVAVVAGCSSSPAPGSAAPATSAVVTGPTGRVGVPGPSGAAGASGSVGRSPGPPPWPVPADQVALIREAGLTPLSAEGTVQHTHAALQVWYAGRRVTVPAQIGIDSAAQQLSPIHTHDRTGMIHVESPTRGTFRLGQFFVQWGVPLNGARAWLDGRPVADPAGIVLQDHQMILVAWGTPPTPIPAAYTEGYYPGQVPPDVAPSITLAGLPAGFPAPVVAARWNGDVGYLDSLTEQGAQREEPLVAGKLRVFEIKTAQSSSGGTIDLLLWGFDGYASAQRYVAQSAVFVPDAPESVPWVANGTQLRFGPDPNRADGSTLGEVAWVHGPWAIVVLEATAPGVIDRGALIRLAATVEQEAGPLHAP